MATIRASFDQIVKNYPWRRPYTAEEQKALIAKGKRPNAFSGKLYDPVLQHVMDSIPGTPCCLQASHALNLSGVTVPASYPHSWRNTRIKYNGAVYNYILTVVEMEHWLTSEFGEGELVSDIGKHSAIREHLAGRQGLLVLRDSTPGIHTEFWDGHGMIQKGMATDVLLDLPRVLFWDINLDTPPSWLTDYMSSN